MSKRYIILDTETTGASEQDRIIQLGYLVLGGQATEVHNELCFSETPIGYGAMEVHNITPEMLENKPICIHTTAYKRLLELNSLENYLIIHNAPFDVGFLKKEHSFLKDKRFLDNEIIDSLKLARKKSPGKKNTLDALCERYSVDSSDRTLHGALLDARLLAHVYLKMTVGQNNFSDLTVDKKFEKINDNTFKDTFKIIEASDEEKSLHESYFK